jgi:hypothetical protein
MPLIALSIERVNKGKIRNEEKIAKAVGLFSDTIVQKNTIKGALTI